MTVTSIGIWDFPGFTVFAIAIGSLSLAVLAISARWWKSSLASVGNKATDMRAFTLVVTALILVAAGCAAEKPTLLVSGGPPKIPHSLEGREGQCLLCHEAGVAGAPRVPANHVGRTSDICQLCHIGAGTHAPSTEMPVTAMPAGGPPQTLPAIGTAQKPSPASGPPRIPHTLQGREGQCLLCHEAGVGGAPKVPANHAGRTSDICTGCHQASAAGS